VNLGALTPTFFKKSARGKSESLDQAYLYVSESVSSVLAMSITMELGAQENDGARSSGA
jgi:hypothetical protein